MDFHQFTLFWQQKRHQGSFCTSSLASIHSCHLGVTASFVFHYAVAFFPGILGWVCFAVGWRGVGGSLTLCRCGNVAQLGGPALPTPRGEKGPGDGGSLPGPASLTRRNSRGSHSAGWVRTGQEGPKRLTCTSCARWTMHTGLAFLSSEHSESKCLCAAGTFDVLVVIGPLSVPLPRRSSHCAFRFLCHWAACHLLESFP